MRGGHRAAPSPFGVPAPLELRDLGQAQGGFDHQSHQHCAQEGAPDFLHQRSDAAGLVVNTGVVQTVKQLGDLFVGKYLGVVFGGGPIDGQEPVIVGNTINAAMVNHLGR